MSILSNGNGGNGGNGGRTKKTSWHGRDKGYLTDEDIENLPRGEEAFRMFHLIGNQKSINNKIFHKLLYYSVFGHIFKDVVQGFWGKKNTGMRHFLGLVGPSTIGKSRAIDNAVSLLSAFQHRLLNNGIDPIYAGINPTVLSGGSPEKIGSTLQRLSGNVYYHTEEFGKFLDTGSKRYMEGFDELMILAIDGKPIKNETFSNPFYIPHPQMSYTWATTREKFVKHDMIHSYMGGWMARGVVYHHDIDQKTSRSNEETMENTRIFNMSSTRDELTKAMTAAYLLTRSRVCPYWGLTTNEEGREIFKKTRERMREISEDNPVFEGTISRNLDYMMKWSVIDTIMSRLASIIYTFGSRDHLVDGFKVATLEFTKGKIQSYERIVSKVDKKTGEIKKKKQFFPISVEEPLSLNYKLLFTVDNKFLRKNSDFLCTVFDSTVTLCFSSQYNEQIERFLHELKKNEGLISEEQLLSKTNWIADRDYNHLIKTLLKREEILPVITKGNKGFHRNYFCNSANRTKQKRCNNKCSIWKLCPAGGKGVS